MPFRRTVRRPRPGDEIRAEYFDYLAGEIERCQVNPGKGILVDSGPAGTIVSVSAGAYVNIRWVLTQSAGIPYATTATAGTVVTLTPGSALCYNSTLNANGTWTADTSVTAALKVFNDWTSSTSTYAGVGGKWICVGTAPDGSTRCLGDPC